MFDYPSSPLSRAVFRFVCLPRDPSCSHKDAASNANRSSYDLWYNQVVHPIDGSTDGSKTTTKRPSPNETTILGGRGTAKLTISKCQTR